VIHPVRAARVATEMGSRYSVLVPSPLRDSHSSPLLLPTSISLPDPSVAGGSLFGSPSSGLGVTLGPSKDTSKFATPLRLKVLGEEGSSEEEDDDDDDDDEEESEPDDPVSPDVPDDDENKTVSTTGSPERSSSPPIILGDNTTK